MRYGHDAERQPVHGFERGMAEECIGVCRQQHSDRPDMAFPVLQDSVPDSHLVSWSAYGTAGLLPRHSGIRAAMVDCVFCDRCRSAVVFVETFQKIKYVHINSDSIAGSMLLHVQVVT